MNPSSQPKISDKAPTTLAAVKLHHNFLRQIEKNIFGSCDALGELAIYSREVERDAIDSDQRVLAFVLANVFELLSSDQKNRPVMLSEVELLRRAFLQPVTDAVDYFANGTGDPTLISNAMIVALSSVLQRY